MDVVADAKQVLPPSIYLQRRDANTMEDVPHKCFWKDENGAAYIWLWLWLCFLTDNANHLDCKASQFYKAMCFVKHFSTKMQAWI